MLGLREHDEAIAPLSLAELVFNKFFCKEISIVSRLKSKPGQAASPNDNHSHAVAQNEYKTSKKRPSRESLRAVSRSAARRAQPAVSPGGCGTRCQRCPSPGTQALGCPVAFRWHPARGS